MKRLSTMAYLENIVWALGSMALSAFIFHHTQSMHALWPVVIALLAMNVIKTVTTKDKDVEQ